MNVGTLAVVLSMSSFVRNSRLTFSALFVVLVLAAFISCKDKSYSAAQQAELYYTQLLSGQYEEFIRGSYGCQSLPSDYLSQRVDMLAQHVKVEQSRHGGYVRFKAIREEILQDSTHLVYLEVLFGDSTRETIVCPMLRQGERWLMRN